MKPDHEAFPERQRSIRPHFRFQRGSTMFVQELLGGLQPVKPGVGIMSPEQGELLAWRGSARFVSVREDRPATQ